MQTLWLPSRNQEGLEGLYGEGLDEEGGQEEEDTFQRSQLIAEAGPYSVRNHTRNQEE